MLKVTRQQRADTVKRIWWAGVRAVDGNVAAARSLGENPIPAPDRIVAVGKAAVAMAQAAFDRFGHVPTLAITKQGHRPPEVPFEVLEASHPIPDAASLAAGARLFEAITSCKPGSHVLLLVSGGASSLVEAPLPGISLAAVIALNKSLLASGKDIATMNAERKRYSRIKGGRLLECFAGARVTVLALSDVQGDAIATIGSGIGECPDTAGFRCETRIVASNAVARAACAAEAARLGLPVLVNEETLYGDVSDAATRIGGMLSDSRTGIFIWGGEPTVVLPASPGRGGRNQALALLLSREIFGQPGTTILVAGTDGSDGPTEAAGGIIDGASWEHDAGQAAVATANSGAYLADRSALFVTGPTGTNVMDLVVAMRS